MATSHYVDNAVPAATEADARAQLDRWAREVGFQSLDAYLDQLPDSDSDPYLVIDGAGRRYVKRTASAKAIVELISDDTKW